MLWNVLSFLVVDVTDFWIDNRVLMVGAQRLNFLLFFGKAGVYLSYQGHIVSDCSCDFLYDV